MAKFSIHYPVKYAVLTQPFGARPEFYSKYGIKGHNGLDYLTVHGQPVYAAHDGEVTYCGGDKEAGVGVVLRTTEPFELEGGTYYAKSIYWHLVDEKLPVTFGQKVKVGDLLGHADNTGNSSGDHLHFCIKPQAKDESNYGFDNVLQTNGYNGAVDPTPYFSGFYAVDIDKVNANLTAQVGILAKIIELLKGFKK